MAPRKRDLSMAKGLGVIASDLDNDGDVDIYVANDTTANFLYLNDGKGYFQELGEARMNCCR
ncbi:MAG: VCBS repeat-containing protein [Pirellulales bacterium]